MSLLMVFTYPSLAKEIEKRKLEVEARLIASELRLARQEAIFNEKPQRILFYLFNNSYRIQGGPMVKLSAGNRFEGNTTFTTKHYGIPYCEFLPSGAPASGGTVFLQNENNDKIYIIVNPVAGRVRISDKPPDNW